MSTTSKYCGHFTGQTSRNTEPTSATSAKRAFVTAYAIAREAWREGNAAVFPPGTYWLRRFAHVTVAEA